jgi:hypothetical protein
MIRRFAGKIQVTLFEYVGNHAPTVFGISAGKIADTGFAIWIP